MKCAVAVVLALIGIAVANPVGVPVGIAPLGLGIASPLLVPSPAGVGYGYGINHGQTITVLRSLPIKYPILAPPLSVGLPAIGYNWGLGGLGVGGWGKDLH